MEKSLWGSLLVLVSAAGFGIMGVAAKIAYAEGANAVFVLFVRFVIAAALLWLYIIAAGRIKDALASREQLIRMYVLGGVLYFITSMCFFVSLNYIPACLTSIVLYLYPVLVNIYMFICGKEKIGFKQLAALVMAFLGTIMMVWAPGIYVNIIGVLFALTAALCYSAYIIMLGGSFAKGLDGLDPMIVSAYIVTSSAVSMLVTAFFTRQLYNSITVKGWGAVVAIALFSTALAIITFYLGVKEVGPSRASILSTFEPVVTVMLGVLVLKEYLSLVQFVGIVLVISAVVLINLAGAGQRETADQQ